MFLRGVGCLCAQLRQCRLWQDRDACTSLCNCGAPQTKDGPEVNQATSIRYLDLPSGPVLCVSSLNGTQIFSEDASTLLFFAPLDSSAVDASKVKFHQGACHVPNQQHIVIGTSKGTLLAVFTSGGFVALPESTSSANSEVQDVCYHAIGNFVVSVHSNGDLRTWQVTEGTQGYVNQNVLAESGIAPVRCAPIGPRILVAYGPGTVCLFDAFTLELQVELTAHARWITAVSVREELGQIATVGEDTVLNVWKVEEADGEVSLLLSNIVADKLLTGVDFSKSGMLVSAYDSEQLFQVTM